MPLNNRVFTVLLLSGIRFDVPTGLTDEFIVVQLPVNLAKFPSTITSRSRHMTSSKPRYQPDPKTKPPLTQDQLNECDKGLVQGYYASVEKLSRTEDSTDWVMSTASDAGGWVPKSFYKFAVPNKIAQDVAYVYKYINDNRGKPGWPRTSAADPTSSPPGKSISGEDNSPT